MRKKQVIGGVLGVTAAAVTAAVVMWGLRNAQAVTRRGKIGDTVPYDASLCVGSEEQFLMPTESIRRILQPYRTLIPVPVQAAE